MTVATEPNPFVVAERSDVAPILMTAEEVGELLRLKVWTVQDLARRNEIPSIKVGRARRFVRSEIEAYVHAQMAKRGS